ncbi:MAG: FAD-binding oxidoreductase, partial [Chloroflexi bacterium]|nr:FAD-binding oxidoreductase [Chloroflexota bacterium]
MKTVLHRDLARILGDGGVSSDRETLARFSGDALGVFRAFHRAPDLDARPAVVAWPVSSQQVASVLRYANEQRIPVVPYGGGTGVMGAAVSVDSSIVLNTRRMNRVLDVNSRDLTVRVEPGAILQDVHNALNAEGMKLGHDPWSRPIATIGGAISTDGVGYTAAAHGSMGDQALGLEIALASGEIIKTRPVPKGSYGPSVDRLFIGSEGILGVITEATIRVFPRPERRILRSIVFPDFETGYHALVETLAHGVEPTVLDFGDEPDSGGEATLFVSFEGFEAHVSAHWDQAKEICEKFDGKPGDQGEVERYWQNRHSSAERYQREILYSDAPSDARVRRSHYRMEYLHVALPISHVLEYRQECQRILNRRKIQVREWS